MISASASLHLPITHKSANPSKSDSSPAERSTRLPFAYIRRACAVFAQEPLVEMLDTHLKTAYTAMKGKKVKSIEI
jgi:hypothetical protein